MPRNEDDMPRVIWRLKNDAMRPKEAPWGFVGQNPVQRVIPPGATLSIDTGISANVPMIASARGDQASYVTVQTVVPAGQAVFVSVENTSRHAALVIDDGEAIVNLTPLVFRGTSEVD